MGNMGSWHMSWLGSDKIPGLKLVAMCDVVESKLQKYPDYRHFLDYKDLLKSNLVDAILVATPHYSHTTIGIDALNAGYHVLVEKPISVHKADCERLIAAHRDPNQIFAAMFNQRTDSVYQKIRQMVQGGELGKIQRINWIITDWFRTHKYYSSGGWRATWAGEGGGVLLNQCPHNLDLFQWIFGMPQKVRGFCQFGRYHDIEVEDSVTAYMEYDNGCTGVFITTTGEAPGTNRLEVTGEQGKLVMEGGKLTYTRNEIQMSRFSRETPFGFGQPDIWHVDVPVVQKGEQHAGILKNFTNAVLHGEPLLSPAQEGIKSVELANAIILSTLRNETIELPLCGKQYEEALMGLIDRSGQKPKKEVSVDKAVAEDFANSFK